MNEDLKTPQSAAGVASAADGAPAEDIPVVISSYVVEVVPEYVQAVADSLVALEGVEVHEVLDHKIVATIEAASLDATHETASKFIQFTGVLGVNLVYANFEDDPQVKNAPTPKSTKA